MNKSKWTLKDQAIILKRLCRLLEKGYTLNDALNFLYVNEKGKKKDDLHSCMKQLASGLPFRQALNQLNFHRDVISYLYFAEQYGDLEFALRKSGEILQKKIIHLEKLLKILRYPVLLIIAVTTIVSIMQSVIMPQFQQLYHSMNIEESFYSVSLMFVFTLSKWTAFLSLVTGGGAVLYYFIFYRRKDVVEQMGLLLRIPIIRHFLPMYHSYFFALQLSNLLRGGMSMFESLKTFQSQNILPFYQVEAGHFIKKLKAGAQLHQIIEERGFYEKELSIVILHGQANGQLARELYMYSQLVIEKIENNIIRALTIIQPSIYTLVGIAVLFVYLSMLLPMYKLMESI